MRLPRSNSPSDCCAKVEQIYFRPFLVIIQIVKFQRVVIIRGGSWLTAIICVRNVQMQRRGHHVTGLLTEKGLATWVPWGASRGLANAQLGGMKLLVEGFVRNFEIAPALVTIG